MPLRLVSRALLVVLGVAVPVLLLEVVLRVFGPVIPGNYETGVWAEGHPVVGHYHNPGASAWIREPELDRKSTRLNSSHSQISYAVFCLKKKSTSYTSSRILTRPMI